MEQNLNHLKVIVIGNSGVGKTSIVNKWCKNSFQETYKPTVISDFSYKIVEHKGKQYRIQMWDICGQDRNIGMTKVFGKNSHGCIIVSEITNENSLEIASKWKAELDKECNFLQSKDKIPTILIQNKIDLVKNPDLNKKKIEKIVKNDGYINYFNVSAKTGSGIDEAVFFLIKSMSDKLEEYCKTNDIEDDRASIVVQPSQEYNQKETLQNNCPC